MSDPRAVAILPARLASTRLPRKMLLEAAGQPLVVHAARNAQASGVFARVVVATDAKEVAQAVRAAGFEAVLTRADQPSGTDRVHEAWRTLSKAGETARVIVGVQGDEPELEPADLARLVAAFADPAVGMATLAAPLDDPALFESAHVVKLVTDVRGDALYFSRAPIPARGHAPFEARDGTGKSVLQRHVGVYAFTPAALERFCALPRGVYEMRENLEQLRWLEAGERLRVVPATRAPVGIDTREDFERFRARLEGERRACNG